MGKLSQEFERKLVSSDVGRLGLVADRDVPPILFHYTTPDGLVGILDSGTLHASNASFLNDSSELEYAHGLIKDQLRGMEGGDLSNVEEALLRDLEDYVNPFRQDLDVYAFCMTTEDDQLSQWRGYGRGAGFSIGIDPRPYAERPTLEPAPPIRAVRIEYDERRQRDAIERAFQWTIHELGAATQRAEAEDLVDMLEKARRFIRVCCSQFLVSFKSPAFAEENEWRLVHVNSRIAQNHLGQLRFRVSGDVLVPYVRMAPPGEEHARPTSEPHPETGAMHRHLVPVRSIVLGPRQNQALAAKAVDLLLRRNGYDPARIQVRRSRVPLRF